MWQQALHEYLVRKVSTIKRDQVFYIHYILIISMQLLSSYRFHHLVQITNARLKGQSPPPPPSSRPDSEFASK